MMISYTIKQSVVFCVIIQIIFQKIRTGRDMGLCAAFLMYPETADLLPALFGRQRNG